MLLIDSDFIGKTEIMSAIIKHSKNSNLMGKLEILSERQDCYIAIQGYSTIKEEFYLVWYKDEEHFLKEKHFMVGAMVKHSETNWGIHT